MCPQPSAYEHSYYTVLSEPAGMGRHTFYSIKLLRTGKKTHLCSSLRALTDYLNVYGYLRDDAPKSL
jgi:hypothetical protein